MAVAPSVPRPPASPPLRGQDITEIREIASEQARVADDLSRLIDTANAPIFGVDSDGMVTEWNRKASEMLGYSKEETMGKHLVGNFIQKDREGSRGSKGAC